jgi:hypothetical protein
MKEFCYAVSATLIKDTKNRINIMTDLRRIKANSKEEAIGVYIMEVSEQFKEHQIWVRPVAMQV